MAACSKFLLDLDNIYLLIEVYASLSCSAAFETGIHLQPQLLEWIRYDSWKYFSKEISTYLMHSRTLLWFVDPPLFPIFPIYVRVSGLNHGTSLTLLWFVYPPLSPIFLVYVRVSGLNHGTLTPLTSFDGPLCRNNLSSLCYWSWKVGGSGMLHASVLVNKNLFFCLKRV